MLEVEYSKESERFLHKIPRKHAGQLVRRVELLRSDPFASDTKQLQNSFGFYRADSGEYRIVYMVIDQVLFVALLGKRNDDAVYKKLGRKLR